MWLPRLASLGHEVIASGALSFSGAPLEWEGFTVLPGWRDLATGNDIIGEHYRQTRADLLITLCDSFVLQPEVLGQMRAMCWTPVDTYPCDPKEAAVLATAGAIPVAMSRFGENALREAGLSPVYVPHGIDTTVFSPGDRAAGRRAAGLGLDTFIIGINSANRDAIRKGFAEQFRAFAIFRERHPGSVLMVHSSVSEKTALNLQSIAVSCGLGDDVLFPDQYEYATGQISAAQMAGWYRMLDVLSNCSYGEGFGLPVIEAQACGIPVVVTDCSAMTELCGAGWKVPGDPFWVPLHSGWWKRPDVPSVVAAYEAAWQAREDGTALGGKAREFALGYDADLVLHKHWQPALEQAAAGQGGK